MGFILSENYIDLSQYLDINTKSLNDEHDSLNPFIISKYQIYIQINLIPYDD